MAARGEAATLEEGDSHGWAESGPHQPNGPNDAGLARKKIDQASRMFGPNASGPMWSTNQRKMTGPLGRTGLMSGFREYGLLD
jgi:hypothetical protein